MTEHQMVVRQIGAEFKQWSEGKGRVQRSFFFKQNGEIFISISEMFVSLFLFFNQNKNPWKLPKQENK